MQFIKIGWMLLFPLITLSQISFFRKYSNEGFDRGEGVVQLKDSSYLITGSSSSFLPDSKQAFIMQVDSVGNFLWSRHYGGSESDKGRRIFHVENDGIYVLGQSNSSGTSFYDAYFFKTDVQGNLIFENRYGGDSYEDIFDAVMLKDTSFIAVGETSSTQNEVEDVYIFRVNKYGERLWTKSLGTVYSDKAKAIKMYDDTTVYVVGEMYDESLLKQRGMLMKMHTDGTVEWTKFYGSESKHGFNDLHIHNDTIRMVGYTQRDLSVQKYDYFRIICNLNGDYTDEQFVNFTGSHSLNGIQLFNTNELVISVTVKDEPAIPTYENGVDNILYRYNLPILSANAIIKVSRPYDDIVNQLIQTNDGGVLCVGYNSDLNFERVTLLKIDGRSNFTYEELVMDDANLVKIQEQDKLKVLIYPNPASEILYVKSDSPLSGMKLYNSLGQLVCKTSESVIDVSGFESGIYFLEMLQEGKTIKSKISIRN